MGRGTNPSPDNGSSDMEWEEDRTANNEQEEGELSDSEPGSDRDSKTNKTPRHDKFLFNSNGKDSLDRSAFNEDDLVAMEKRANRFGLSVKSDSSTLDNELKQLYHTLNIITDDDVRHSRFDTIHIRGTEKMNTNDIFEYFFTHKPLFLEWIDENSCNVAWKDNISAARAMIFYSKAIKCHDIQKMEDDSENTLTTNIWNDAIEPSDIPIPIPTGRWRAGAPHPKSEFLFLRFANKSDKKINEDEKLKIFSKKYDLSDDANYEIGKVSESMKSRIQYEKEHMPYEEKTNKNPWGDLCKSWGINDSQEVFLDKNVSSYNFAPNVDPFKKSVKERIGAIPVHQRLTFSKEKHSTNNLSQRLGKRKISQRDSGNTESEHEGSSSDEEWRSKSKLPRMRMHADDEEEKMAKNKVNTKSKKIQNIIINTIKNETTSDNEVNDSDEQSPPKYDNSYERIRSTETETKTSIYSRLGKRYSSESDGEEHENVRSTSSVINKIRPNVTQNIASTVWSRLDFSKNRKEQDSEDDSENENRTDLRHTLSQNKIKSTISEKPDLRERIRKKRNHERSPLRIEIENELYSDRM